MRINMPENIEYAIKTLSDAGFKAYIVGGCVRDSLLGIVPTDYDICTSAHPDDVTRIFDKTVNTGIKHGTVTAIVENEPIEITTFRTEDGYADFRRPDKVKFVNSLKEDLSRRDFTVNAMCYNKSEGLIDYFGGIDDLNKGILRTVGNADARFKEDALRILRLFRFASVLGFTPEEKTLNAAITNAPLLKNISAERIEKELRKTSCGKKPSAVLPLIDTGVLPTLKSNRDIAKISLLPQKYNLKFFAFLYLLSNDLTRILSFLKCSNAFKKYAVSLSEKMSAKAYTRPEIKRLMNYLEEDIFDLFALKSVLLSENTEKQIKTVREVLNTGEPYKISQLAVDGNDITAKGYTGKEINAILSRLLEKVISDPTLNEKEILKNLI